MISSTKQAKIIRECSVKKYALSFQELPLKIQKKDGTEKKLLFFLEDLSFRIMFRII